MGVAAVFFDFSEEIVAFISLPLVKSEVDSAVTVVAFDSRNIELLLSR